MKTIVGIFAHPDDEALGPSGTIALLAKDYQVDLICVTNGDSANGHPNPELAEKRKKELENSAKILGVSKVFFLNFGDGKLSNSLYHEVAKKIEEIIKDIKPEIIITIEHRGISGHIDHIFVSMVTTYVFEKTKFVKELWYHCIDERLRKFIKNYFIYFPPGYKKEQVDKVIDVSSAWNTKRKAMLQHKSQIKDVLAFIGFQMLLPKEEYFLVRKR